MSRALDEGCVTNGGPYVGEFEALLGKYLGAPVLCFSSGMSALTAMLMASDVQGKEVILPSFTFAATPSAVLAAGGIPVFADIDHTLTLDPADIEKRIGPRTGAILGVDAYGISSDYQAINKIAKRHNIKILRDSAPAFGSHVRGLEDITGIYSFHATKAFAVGEGGCLVSKDETLMARAKLIRNFGIDRNHKWQIPGINGKMTEISAIIGIESLKGWPDRLRARRQVKDSLDFHLTRIPGVETTETAPATTSWCYCPILIDQEVFGCTRDELKSYLERDGILTRKYYSACHLEPRSIHGNFHAHLPRTERVVAQVLALPCYESITALEIDRIVAAFKNIQNLCSAVKQ